MEGFDKFMPNNNLFADAALVGRDRNVEAQINRWWDEILGEEEGLRRPVFREPKAMKAYIQKPEMHGKELFDRVLRDLKEIYEEDFVIAGGAVRDLHMGCSETSPDVDIFIPMSYERFIERFNELGWPGAPAKIAVQPYNKGKEWDNSSRAQYIFKGSRLDLVFIDKPLTPAMVQSFPIHAQRCVYTLEEGMNISPDALIDLTNKRFTISPTITDKDYIKHLTGKVMSWKARPEYKDFKIGLPRGNEWWMKVNSDHNLRSRKTSLLNTKGKVK